MSKTGDSITLGDYLRRTREAAGLSTRDVATMTGIDKATVARIENGSIDEPRPDKLKALAEALHLSVGDLFALAGYGYVPPQLPSFTHYLRAKYRTMPPEAIQQLQLTFAEIAERYGFNAAGPLPGEDEDQLHHHAIGNA